MTRPADLLERYRGSLVGGALGDAMGRPTEFDDEPNAGRVRIALPRPALVTDDTQMALAVAAALPGPAGQVETRLVEEFVRWRTTDHHRDRAPGLTCLTATEALAAGSPWHQATVPDSKGCGGVMRAHPCAFAQTTGVSPEVLGVLQSGMTHGHPTADLAAAAWVTVVRAAATDVPPGQWLALARRTVEDPEVGEFILTRMQPDLPVEEGRTEMLSALEATGDALRTWNLLDDPCDLTGEGWTAEEAVATALLVAITFAQDPEVAISRAARTCGDSDSLASMVGALLGAQHGMSRWPTDWVEALEEPYRTAALTAEVPVLD